MLKELLCSLQFHKRAQWYVNSVPEVKEGNWADCCADWYLRWVLRKMQKIKLDTCFLILNNKDCEN